MNTEISADYVIVYSRNAKIVLECYDYFDIAMDRFLFLALRNSYVTLFNQLTKSVECSIIPCSDVKLREQPTQLALNLAVG